MNSQNGSRFSCYHSDIFVNLLEELYLAGLCDSRTAGPVGIWGGQDWLDHRIQIN